MSTPTLGSEIRSIVHVVQARLNGTPDTSAEWRTIARQLRQASDRASKIALLAARMEAIGYAEAVAVPRQLAPATAAQHLSIANEKATQDWLMAACQGPLK